jgi:DNA helicase-2/ATP-dependent DNA helicase PcrA
MKPENDDFVPITSDSELTDFDYNFRVMAGPGAGKTYWLIKNIRNILRNSPRISSASRIACITYTNVASDEIRAGLEKGEDRVETSTIHSFLYKNIVKPYAFLLKKEDGTCLIDFEKMDGHDEHRPAYYPFVRDWVDSLPEMNRNKFQFADSKRQQELVQCLGSLNWKMESGKCVLEFRRNFGLPKPLVTSVEKYKRQFWDRGQIHHEDVLYFSYRILAENPSLCDFLSSKFAYILIDEFQDTHPIQTEIVRLLAASGSIIGIIGDGAQSIYQFQGARRKDFLEFAISNQVNYKIEGNRRSTKKIINLLNHVRSGDPVKQKQQGVERDGQDVHVLVGDDAAKLLSAYEALARDLGYEDKSYILAIKNDTVYRLKSKKNSNEGSWEQLRAMDRVKARFLEHLIASEEYAHEGRFETALKEALRVFKDDIDGTLKEPFKSGALPVDIEKRGAAVSMLEFIISNRESLTGGNALNFYEQLNDFLFRSWQIRLQEFSKGKKRNEYEAVQVSDLLSALRLGEESKSAIRTIHKSKGAQFKSVLVYLDNPDHLAHILRPDINADEDSCRLIYVGLSRAEEFLCISIPKVDAEDEQGLRDLGLNVIRV